MEITGIPFSTSRCYRVSHCAFLRGIFGITTTVCIVKPSPAPEQRPDGLTVTISWV